MPSKLEQLKKEIQMVKPEIIELKFGCELLWHDNQVHKIIEIDNNKFWTNLTNNHCGHNFGFTLKGDLQTEVKEILGRPITLEDVLAVLNTLNKTEVRIDVDGEFLKFEKQDLIDNVWEWEETDIYWLLGKALDDQTEETINFIHSLIFE